MNNNIKKYISTFILIVVSMMFGSVITMFLSEKANVTVSKYNSEYKEFKPLFEAYDILNEEYYKDLKSSKLVDGAINGMLEATKDKHTMYFNKKQKKEFEEELSGEYYGIGAEIKLNENKTVSIVKIFDNSPAEKAGLKIGDVFVEIDGKSMKGKNANEVSNTLRSSKVKTADVVIKRDGKKISYKVTKENITLYSVSSEMIDKVGYISINVFGEKTYEQFFNALTKLENEGMESLIIDVRGNSGGYLSTVTNILSIFMDNDTVIYQMKIKNKKEEFKSVMPGKKDYKVIVLMDKGSASASEILASSMKEKYGATLVGTKTYGKGTVQSTSVLSNDTMIKYTIQEWLTPLGNSIDKKGVKPDVEIELSEDYVKNPIRDNDNQLNKAIELLK